MIKNIIAIIVIDMKVILILFKKKTVVAVVITIIGCKKDYQVEGTITKPRVEDQVETER